MTAHPDPTRPEFTTLQIGTGWFPESSGGLERFYYNLLQNLPNTGVGVRGLVVGSPDVVRQSNGRVRAFAAITDSLPHRMIAARRGVTGELRDHRPDLVSSHFALFAAPSLDIVRKLPLVVQFQGPWAQEAAAEVEMPPLKSRLRSAAMSGLERLVYSRAARLIVLSQASAKILQRSYGIQERLIRVVPGGVELERFSIGDTKEHARQALGLPLDRPLLVSVRRLSRRMGLENLIEAMADVRTKFPEILLAIAGGGALAGDLQRRIDSLGLTRNVQLLGFVSDEKLPLLYRAADFSVVPTISLEGFGLTTVESLAAGTPVLVTPAGALPEVVGPLSPDLILPSITAAAIADGIAGILSGGTRLPTPEACRAYVEARFTWERVAQATRDVYREVLSES